MQPPSPVLTETTQNIQVASPVPSNTLSNPLSTQSSSFMKLSLIPAFLTSLRGPFLDAQATLCICFYNFTITLHKLLWFSRPEHGSYSHISVSGHFAFLFLVDLVSVRVSVWWDF